MRSQPRADEEKLTGWAQTVRAVNAPLGFYVLCLLIVESSLAFVLVQPSLSAADRFSGLLLSAVLFILVVFLTTYLVIVHPESLVFGPKDHLRRRELERQTAAERLERAQAEAGEEMASMPLSERRSMNLETVAPMGDERSGATEYLALEGAAFDALRKALRPGFALVSSVRLDSGHLVDAVVTGPDGGTAAVIEVKSFRLRRAVGDRIRAAIFQLQHSAELFVTHGGHRPVQLLVWATGSDAAVPTPAQLRTLAPLFASSTTYFAVYTRWDDAFRFLFDLPPFAHGQVVDATLEPEN